MRDEYERIDNRAQAIRSLDKFRLARFLTHIVENSKEYPQNTIEWLDWLNAESGESIYKL